METNVYILIDDLRPEKINRVEVQSIHKEWGIFKTSYDPKIKLLKKLDQCGFLYRFQLNKENTENLFNNIIVFTFGCNKNFSIEAELEPFNDKLLFVTLIEDSIPLSIQHKYYKMQELLNYFKPNAFNIYMDFLENMHKSLFCKIQINSNENLIINEVLGFILVSNNKIRLFELLFSKGMIYKIPFEILEYIYTEITNIIYQLNPDKKEDYIKALWTYLYLEFTNYKSVDLKFLFSNKFPKIDKYLENHPLNKHILSEGLLTKILKEINLISINLAHNLIICLEKSKIIDFLFEKYELFYPIVELNVGTKLDFSKIIKEIKMDRTSIKNLTNKIQIEGNNYSENNYIYNINGYTDINNMNDFRINNGIKFEDVFNCEYNIIVKYLSVHVKLDCKDELDNLISILKKLEKIKDENILYEETNSIFESKIYVNSDDGLYYESVIDEIERLIGFNSNILKNSIQKDINKFFKNLLNFKVQNEEDYFIKFLNKNLLIKILSENQFYDFNKKLIEGKQLKFLYKVFNCKNNYLWNIPDEYVYQIDEYSKMILEKYLEITDFNMEYYKSMLQLINFKYENINGSKGYLEKLFNHIIKSKNITSSFDFLNFNMQAFISVKNENNVLSFKLFGLFQTYYSRLDFNAQIILSTLDFLIKNKDFDYLNSILDLILSKLNHDTYRINHKDFFYNDNNTQNIEIYNEIKANFDFNRIQYTTYIQNNKDLINLLKGEIESDNITFNNVIMLETSSNKDKKLNYLSDSEIEMIKLTQKIINLNDSITSIENKINKSVYFLQNYLIKNSEIKDLVIQMNEFLREINTKSCKNIQKQFMDYNELCLNMINPFLEYSDNQLFRKFYEVFEKQDYSNDFTIGINFLNLTKNNFNEVIKILQEKNIKGKKMSDFLVYFKDFNNEEISKIVTSLEKSFEKRKINKDVYESLIIYSNHKENISII